MLKKLEKFPWKIIALVILPVFYIFLYHLYSPRVSAFGCFDDCFNYVAGYFLLKGKTLYSEIFFNHQPLMAHLSRFVQFFSQPINIYQLVLRHRQLVFFFGFLMNGLLIWRFGLAGFGFALFYELSKFYLFGDRFLAEGLIIYPLVYLTGLAWFKIKKIRIYSFEYLLGVLFTWFIIFSRLSFIPLALFLYFFLLWEKPFREKVKKISFFTLAALIFLTLIFAPFQDYFFNVAMVNLKTGRFSGFNISRSFFYPIYLFFGGQWEFFRYFLVGLDLIFLTLLLFLLLSKKRKFVGIIFLVLGLAGLRVEEFRRVFYDIFHFLPWYGLFLFLIFLSLVEIYRQKKKTSWLMLPLLILLFLFFVFSPQSFIHEEVDPHEEFITNFGHELQVGEVVKILSHPTDTLFLDGFDDLIYWQANRLSPYQYSWYTSVMPQVAKYAEARLEMFRDYPPDFYYGTCPDKEISFWMMPEEFIEDYQQLYSLGEPTCLYIRKTKIPRITEEQWQKAKNSPYELHQ